MATPKDILKVIIQDISKQNIFNCNIKVPSLSELNSYVSTEDNRLLEYYVQDASLPSYSLSLVETRHLGKIKYAVTGQSVDSINVVFYDTKKQRIRKLFKTWIDAISSMNKNQVLMYYPSSYQTTLHITVHDNIWTVKSATPVSIGDFVLSSTSDTVGTFSVSFKCKDVVSEG